VGFPNLLSDTTEFTYRIPLTGSPPFVLGAVSVPDFFDVTIEEDDPPGTWSIVFTLNRSLTGADEGEDYLVSVDVTNCTSGVGSYNQFFDVIAPPSFFILQRIAGVANGSGQSIDLSLDAGVTGTIYWGDGTSDPIANGGAPATLTFTHTYAAAIGEALQLFVIDTNAAFTQFQGDQFSGLPVTYFTHSAAFTNFVGAKIHGLRTYGDVVLPGATALSILYLFGHSISPDTTIDLSGLAASVHSIGIQEWPLLNTITNMPATITNEENIRNNSVLTSIDDSLVTGALFFYSIVGCPSLPSSEIVAKPNLGNSLQIGIFGNGYTTADINAILIYIDSAGASGKIITITEGGTAPPSGAGATAKANLISRGNTVTTD
jgi:hypothetical protein